MIGRRTVDPGPSGRFADGVADELRRLGGEAGAASGHLSRALSVARLLLGWHAGGSPRRLSEAIPAPHVSLSDGDFVLKWSFGDRHVAVMVPDEEDDLYVHVFGFGPESTSSHRKTLPLTYLRARLNQMYPDVEAGIS